MSTVISWDDLPVRRYDVRGASLAVACARAAGPPDEPVLLVPGFTGGKEDFAGIARLVADEGFGYYAMDQRGQHESTGPEDPRAYTVAALAEDVVALVRALGVAPAHLLGHNFGGLIARAAVIAAPSLFRSLTLMSSGPAALVGVRADVITLLTPVLDAGGMGALYDARQAARPDDPSGAPGAAEVEAFMRRRFVSSSELGLRVMGGALRSEPDRVAELQAAGVPTLVLFGEGDDAWAPELQAEMAARLAVEHVVIADAVHSPAAEQPAATAAALVRFWRSVPRPPEVDQAGSSMTS